MFTMKEWMVRVTAYGEYLIKELATANIDQLIDGKNATDNADSIAHYIAHMNVSERITGKGAVFNKVKTKVKGKMLSDDELLLDAA